MFVPTTAFVASEIFNRILPIWIAVQNEHWFDMAWWKVVPFVSANICVSITMVIGLIIMQPFPLLETLPWNHCFFSPNLLHGNLKEAETWFGVSPTIRVVSCLLAITSFQVFSWLTEISIHMHWVDVVNAQLGLTNTWLWRWNFEIGNPKLGLRWELQSDKLCNSSRLCEHSGAQMVQ